VNESPEQHWYVVYTKPRQEALARLNLERQCYTCYLPLIPVEKLHRRLRKVVSEPLFPRYLFIRLGHGLTGPGWAPIRSTVGVSHLLRFGDQPVRVDDRLIEQIRRREQAASQTPEPLHKTGDSIRIQEGPYAGLSAIFRMSDGESRALVLIQMLGRQVPLGLPLASITREVA